MANNNLVDFVEIYVDTAGEYRWRAKSNNGKIVASSGEGYQSYAHAHFVVDELFPEAEVRNISFMPPTDIEDTSAETLAEEHDDVPDYEGE